MSLYALQQQQRQREAQKRKPGRRSHMLVMRGLRNDQLELRERAAVQAFALGYATTEHYHILADMHSVMLLAGSTDDSRKWAWTYCTEVTGPALQKIAQRYQRTKVMSVTTGERKVLGEFITRYREFWLRQPLELYEAACQALQAHYDKMSKEAA